MIKKLIFFIIFIIAILLVFGDENFESYSYEQFYELTEDQTIDEINVEIEDVVLKVIYTNNNYIKISRDTIRSRYNALEYTSSYSDNILNIDRYIKSDYGKGGSAKDVVTLEVPISLDIGSINVVAKNCEIDIDGLTVNNLDIDSTEYLNLNITNNTFGNVAIQADNLESIMSNSLIKENIEYNIGYGKIEEENVSGFSEKISSLYSLDYINDNAIYDTTEFFSTVVNLDYTLSSGVKYKFENLGENKYSSYLEKKGGNHYYNKSTEGIPVSVIKCNQNELTNLVIPKKEAVEEI